MKPKKKSKNLTKKDVKRICTQVVFSKYIMELSKNIKKVKNAGNLERNMIEEMRKMQIETSINRLDERLSDVAEKLNDLLQRVLIQDYIIGRLSKAELVESVNQLYPNDPLSAAEHLEEIDKQKDSFEEHLKSVTQKELGL